MSRRLLTLIGALLFAGAVHAATPAQITAAAPGLHPFAIERVGHVATMNIRKVKLEFRTAKRGQVDTGGPTEVAAYLEYAGKLVTITFNGKHNGTKVPGRRLDSDLVKLPFVIPRGGEFTTIQEVLK